jgi:hypothetical protein
MPGHREATGTTALDFRALLAKERHKLLQESKRSPATGLEGASGALKLAPRERLDLRKWKVPGPVDGVYYVPDWITTEEAAQLTKAIDAVSAGSGGLAPPRWCG